MGLLYLYLYLTVNIAIARSALGKIHSAVNQNTGGGVAVAGWLVERSLDGWKLPTQHTVFAASLNISK
jgi:hypothetical protein